MSNHLEQLARRLEDDPFFLACPLRLFAKSEGLSDEGLAAVLRCTKEALVSVRLCRTPSEESYWQGIERIAAKFSLEAGALADAVSRGRAIYHLAQAPNAANTLLAARDKDGGSSKDSRKDVEGQSTGDRP